MVWTSLNNPIGAQLTYEYLLSSHYTFNGQYFDRQKAENLLTLIDLQDLLSLRGLDGTAHIPQLIWD